MANSLRRAVDVAGVLAGIGAAVVIGVYTYRHLERTHTIESTITSLREFDRTIAVRAASRETELTTQGWPRTVDAGWFEGEAPRNPLLSPDRPWLEIAGEREADLLNPPVRIAEEREVAAFWYNPYRGVVRARVPLLISERESVDLYNRINHTAIGACVEPLAPLVAAQPLQSEDAARAEADTPAEQDPPPEGDDDSATRVTDVPEDPAAPR